MSEIDRLNEILIQAGDAIEELGFTVAAEVPFADGALCWKKKGPEWDIVVRTAAGDEIPLLQTSKKMRIGAAARLGALLEALRVAEENANGATLEAIRLATDFVEHCRRAPKASESNSTAGEK